VRQRRKAKESRRQEKQLENRTATPEPPIYRIADLAVQE
jgi:hypothetical protein